MVIWLIGMSGAGKTTIGQILYKELKKVSNNWIYLDGDVLREVWGDNIDHSINGRRLNAHRISNLCQMLDRQKINIIASVLSIFPEWQKWNRENFSKYFEVYLKVNLEILKQRDTKGIYKDALNGKIRNVVGIDIPFPEPLDSDLIIDSSGNSGIPQDLVLKIKNKLDKIRSEI